MISPCKKSYGERALQHDNPAAKLLLETIERKKSNLAVSVDVSDSRKFLTIVDVVGPFVCLIKTHIDILVDFSDDVIKGLQDLSKKHDFVIFEDRKFADIGNTVASQYLSGVHKIATWAHITNAHPVPGPSIISGLSSVGLPLGRGLLLLAEMSTKGSLATGAYTEGAVRMARANRSFVIGFIAQRRFDGVQFSPDDIVDENEDFLVLTPGVSLGSDGDSMGQQYRTPSDVILGSGCDVIIVGRGIYGNNLDQRETIATRAREYMVAGWGAYLQRLEPTKKDETATGT